MDTLLKIWEWIIDNPIISIPVILIAVCGICLTYTKCKQKSKTDNKFNNGDNSPVIIEHSGNSTNTNNYVNNSFHKNVVTSRDDKENSRHGSASRSENSAYPEKSQSKPVTSIKTENQLKIWVNLFCNGNQNSTTTIRKQYVNSLEVRVTLENRNLPQGYNGKLHIVVASDGRVVKSGSVRLNLAYCKVRVQKLTLNKREIDELSGNESEVRVYLDNRCEKRFSMNVKES